MPSVVCVRVGYGFDARSQELVPQESSIGHRVCKRRHRLETSKCYDISLLAVIQYADTMKLIYSKRYPFQCLNWRPSSAGSGSETNSFPVKLINKYMRCHF